MHSQPEPKYSVWYRTYVLLILLLVCISNLATRTQPSFLITIPAPDCAEPCTGVVLSYPTCKVALSPPNGTREKQCAACRTQPAFWQGAMQQLPPAEQLPKAEKQAAVLEIGPAKVQNESQTLRKVQPHHPVTHVKERPREHEAYLNAFQKGELEGLQVDTVSGFYNLADATCLWYWQYGLLIGYGFTLVYAAGIFPAGWLCDRHPRTSIIASSLFVWSLCTSMQAQATSLSLLLACRVMIGLAQSFGTPASWSLLVDYFSGNGRQRDLALSLLTMVGPQLGVGCASFSIIFAELLGWRWVVLLTGLAGIVLSVVVLLTLSEPKRSAWSAPCPPAVVVEEVMEKSRVSRLLMWAVSAKMLSSYSLTAFLPIWYAKRSLEGYSNDAYAFWNALVVSLAALLSVCIGSLIGEAWSRHDARAPCYLGLIGSLGSIPLISMMLLTQHFKASLLCYFLILVFGEAWLGPSLNLLQLAVRSSVRGQATSMLLGVAALAGNLGPALVGILDPGGTTLGVHLLWICCLAQGFAAISFYWTAHEITVDPVSVGLGLTQEKAP